MTCLEPSFAQSECSVNTVITVFYCSFSSGCYYSCLGQPLCHRKGIALLLPWGPKSYLSLQPQSFRTVPGSQKLSRTLLTPFPIKFLDYSVFFPIRSNTGPFLDPADVNVKCAYLFRLTWSVLIHEEIPRSSNYFLSDLKLERVCSRHVKKKRKWQRF